MCLPILGGTIVELVFKSEGIMAKKAKKAKKAAKKTAKKKKK